MTTANRYASNPSGLPAMALITVAVLMVIGLVLMNIAPAVPADWLRSGQVRPPLNVSLSSHWLKHWGQEGNAVETLIMLYEGGCVASAMYPGTNPRGERAELYLCRRPDGMVAGLYLVYDKAGPLLTSGYGEDKAGYWYRKISSQKWAKKTIGRRPSPALTRECWEIVEKFLGMLKEVSG